MKTIKKIALLTLAPLLLQAAPTIGDAMRQAQTPKEVTAQKKKPLVKVQGIKPIYKPALQDNKSFKKVLVKSFTLEGNEHIKSAVLLPLLKSYEDTKLSFQAMKTIAALITKAYREKGYIVARAYIPVQNMNDGVLQIAVIEGRYGEFKLSNKSRLKTSLLQGMLDTSKKGVVINNSSLERSLLLVNDTPGAHISSASITAGKDAGSSDFLVTVEDSKSYDGYALVNNYGGRYTGEKQLTVGVNIYAPFKIGDKLSLVGLLSNGENLRNGSTSYSVPLYYDGLRAEIGYADTQYYLVKEFKSLDATGTSKSFHAKLSYPLIKQKAQSLELFLKLENIALRDETGSTNFKSDKTLNVVRLGLDYTKTDLSWFNLNQQLKASMFLSAGNLKFKDAAQAATDKVGANTQGNNSKIQLSLNYDIALSKKIMFKNFLSYQHTLQNKNLDGSEDFAIGGAYGVKLYPSGELSAENGYLFNTELKYSLANIKTYTHKLGVFYDRGKVAMQNPTATFKSRVLQDTGIGYYANYKKFFTTVQVAWKIDHEKITTEPDNNYKVLWMGGVSF